MSFDTASSSDGEIDPGKFVLVKTPLAEKLQKLRSVGIRTS